MLECPIDAVADAMMIAVYKQISFELRHLRNNMAGQVDMEEILRKATLSGCRLGSAMVLEHLAESKRNLFKKLVMIETHSSGRWAWHDYFLALGIDECWYAGSPANYGREPVERTTALYKNNDLEVIIDEICLIEGGRWPDAESIMEVLDDSDTDITSFEENGRKVMEYFCVSRKGGLVTGERCQIKM